MNKLTAYFALSTLAFGISSIYLFQALQLERERADALQDEVARAEFERDMAATSAVKFPAPATVAEPQPSVSGAPTMPADKHQGEDTDELARRLANPAYRAAQLAFVRLQIEHNFPGLAESLNLQPEEADRLFDLLARQAMDESGDEMEVNLSGQESEVVIAARRQKLEERQHAAEAEQLALLGNAKMSEFNEYRKGLGARAQVRDLRTLLAESGSLLREDQATPLIASLAAEQERHQAERKALYDNANNPTRSSSAEVIQYMGQRLALIQLSLQRRRQAAAMYLDPEQLKHYDEMLDRERQRALVDYDLFVTLNEDAPRGQ